MDWPQSPVGTRLRTGTNSKSDSAAAPPLVVIATVWLVVRSPEDTPIEPTPKAVACEASKGVELVPMYAAFAGITESVTITNAFGLTTQSTPPPSCGTLTSPSCKEMLQTASSAGRKDPLKVDQEMAFGVCDLLLPKDTSKEMTEMSRSEEHTSELQSHSFISYAVFCLK